MHRYRYAFQKPHGVVHVGQVMHIYISPLIYKLVLRWSNNSVLFRILIIIIARGTVGTICREQRRHIRTTSTQHNINWHTIQIELID